MYNAAKTHLIGHIANAEVTSTSGNPYGEIRLGVNNRWKDRETGEQRERADFFSVKIFQKHLLDRIEDGLFRKGRYVLVEASLRMNTWEKEGETRYETQIIADRVHLLEGKREDP